MTAAAPSPALEPTAAAWSDPAFQALRAAWRRRFPPADAAEETALESLIAALWRRRLLDRVEARILEALGAGTSCEGMPSLASLARYAARLAKDIELARARFFGLRRLRLSTSAQESEAASRPSEREQPSAARGQSRTSALRFDKEPLVDFELLLRELLKPPARAREELHRSASRFALSARAA